MLDNTLVYFDKKEVKKTVTSAVLDHTAKGDAYDAPWLAVKTDENFAGGTAYKVLLQTSSDAEFASPKNLIEKTLAPAEMNVKGPFIKQRVPPGTDRYTRLRVEVTGTGTAGALSAFLCDAVSLD